MPVHELPPRVSADELKSIRLLCQQLQQERQIFQQFVEQALDEINALRAELVDSQRQGIEREANAARREQLFEQEQAEYNRLQQDRQTALETVMEELAGARSQAEHVSQERDAAQCRLEETESQMEQLRTKVDQQKRQLLRLKQHLSKNLHALRATMQGGGAATEATEDWGRPEPAADADASWTSATADNSPCDEEMAAGANVSRHRDDRSASHAGLEQETSAGLKRRPDPVVDSVLARFAEMEEELGNVST